MSRSQAASKTNLIDAGELARLVTNVTQPMFGMSFMPGADIARGPSICVSMVLMPIVGKREIDIVLTSDHWGSQALGARMFGLPNSELTPSMVEDAVKELLNMVAGQVQACLKLDQPLGLPRRTSLIEVLTLGGSKLDEAVLLRSDGDIDLKIWVFEVPRK